MSQNPRRILWLLAVLLLAAGQVRIKFTTDRGISVNFPGRFVCAMLAP